ncbi:hypothetical protein DPMN_098352 [Dreissena polymorpha]|uniref:Uncharacterized protein n=1 Tax=Dreissena polymorpha TaxID=45954 RepID=A0A9D4LDI8_DREPO|nr:hypothetical protein DPMN_098352 [Dreissena polymorpha]
MTGEVAQGMVSVSVNPTTEKERSQAVRELPHHQPHQLPNGNPIPQLDIRL